jgi:general secretion pathway protein D
MSRIVIIGVALCIVSMVGWPSPSVAQTRPGTLPSSSGDDADGPLRTKAKKAGVIDPSSGKKKLDFDPKDMGGTASSAEDKLAKDAEDVIEWKTNFEKGIKCKKLPLNTKIRLDFNDIALGDLTKFISCITEQNFILAGGANKSATVSILSPKPVTAYEAYKAYLSALEANSLTIVPNGNFLEIVPSGEAKQQGAPIFGPKKRGPNDDRMVTRLIQLEHIQGQEILPVIEKFKTKSADLTIYAPTNTLIITDTGSNIRRILTLIKELDVPVGKEKIWIRPIQYAEASEMLSMLQNLFQSSGTGRANSSSRPSSSSKSKRKGSKAKSSPSSVVGSSGDVTSVEITKMLSDERTNSIIFVASRSSYLKVDRLLRKIDVPIPGEGQIHIHSLENADAEEIAQTLSSLASSSKGGKSKRSSKGKKKKKKSGGSSSGGALLQGDVKITAYEPTNSLVIESSLKDYLSLQKVIKQLDVRRKQVYVEAIIMEISQNKQKDIGFSGSGGVPDVDIAGEQVPLLFGVGGLGLDVQGALSTLTAGGGAIGMQGPMVDLSGGVSGSGDSASTGGSFSIPAFGFTLQALQTTSNVNVLSTPHILTVENEEAEIQVGKRQPYRNSSGGLGNLSSLAGLAGGAGASALGSLGGLGGLGGLGSQVQYVDVDLTLKIKPQVNASDFVRLEIEQNIDDIEGFFAEAPITSKRKISNIVVVRDGQPVVIGGLMRDSETESVEKVPFLGDIPLLGLLFRKTSTTVEKRNLLLIIIPHVIKDPSDLKQIHQQRKTEFREFSRMMAMRKKEFEGEMDYRKKIGLLQDIHMTVNRARRERELNEQSIFESTEFDSVGPPETHDIEYDPYEAAKDKGDE